MNIQAYLERINYRESLKPTPNTLRELQLAHLYTVPFENLSIHSGEAIVLADEALYAKIVTHRRGGFCYELNGLFAALLRTLGFRVTMLSAAVARDESSYGPAFDHMTLMVELEERWLVDVGFGDSFLEPLRLESRQEQASDKGDHRRAYHIQADGAYWRLSQKDHDGIWSPLFRFTQTPYHYADYAAMCHYHQTSPESHFTQRRICSRATPEGRITLSGMRLITTQNGERQEQELADEAAYTEALWTHFGIVLGR